MNTPIAPKSRPEIIPLYPEGPPGSEAWDQKEQWTEISLTSDKVLRNVSQPTLTAYLPDPAIARGTGVVVCPGGAWHMLAIQHEGIDVATWLNSQGIAAFVLKYRLIQTGEDFAGELQRNLSDPDKMASLMKKMRPLLLNDGQQAIRIVRERAPEWALKKERIGVMGFSAGGSVVVNAALTHSPECRPDFIAAIYAADYDADPVPADAAPLFILCAADDEMASTNSLRLYTEWRSAGRPVELHIYSKGGHGFGMRTMNLPSDGWIDRFVEWLQSQDLCSAPRARRG